jgi:hypothetical protein
MKCEIRFNAGDWSVQDKLGAIHDELARLVVADLHEKVGKLKGSGAGKVCPNATYIFHAWIKDGDYFDGLGREVEKRVEKLLAEKEVGQN